MRLLIRKPFSAESWKWRIQRWVQPWLRKDWPVQLSHHTLPVLPKVGVVTVSYNTKELLAKLIFSLCRIVGSEGGLGPIVVVDNKSTDGSIELIQALAEVGIVTPIFNQTQRYHGPALNQGVNLLARDSAQGNKHNKSGVVDYVFVVDSDVRVLRGDIFAVSVPSMLNEGAVMAGEFVPNDNILGGYAHVSGLLFDPRRVWRRGFSPFEEHGDPALEFERSLVRRNMIRCNFPFTSRYFTLHLWNATLKAIATDGSTTNRYYKWSQIIGDRSVHEGNQQIQFLLEEFDEFFRSEIPSLEPRHVAQACLRGGRIELKRPYELANTIPCSPEVNPDVGHVVCAKEWN